MNLIKALLIATLVMSTSGCVGLFVAGAATTVSVVTDNRTTKEMPIKIIRYPRVVKNFSIEPRNLQIND